MIQIRSFVAAYLLTSSRAFSPSSIPNIRNANTRKQHSHLYASDAEDDRRSFLTKGAGIALVLGVGFAFQSKFPSPPGAPPSSVDFKAVAADISGIVSNDKDKGPTMVRLAWHSSGTYDKMTKSGGSGAGTMYFKEELDHGANAGLAQTAVAWLEPIKKTYGDGLSYADLYTLCGVAAIKELGGPTIPWSSGRVDALDPSAVAPDGRLPNADSGEPGANPDDAAHLRTVFGRMGFNDQEIVALSGAHALGRCHPNFSGYEGPWTATPTTFNNLYYRFLLQIDWKKRDWEGPFQYQDENGRFMMLPTDFVLIKDEKFLKYVQMYAADQDKFFADFSVAFAKLENLGTSNLELIEWA